MASLKYTSVLGGIVLFISLMNSGCDSDEGNAISPIPDMVQCESVSTTPYVFNLPLHFPPFITPVYNQTTEEGVALGRKLYYDKMLSSGGPFEGHSCSSCHLQASSFTNNSQGTAVLPHTNLNWSTHFLWNGKLSGGLEYVMEFEIADFFQANIALFKADPTYQRMNCEAFGSNDISATDMANAMAQWMRTLVSSNSKYDRYLAGEVELTDLESMGEIIFNTNIGDCFKCHSMPLTTDLLFHNNGLNFDGAAPTGENMGRFNVTDDPADIGRFKTPTLRNIALTAPYMHDGRFQTLEEVVEHYNSGVMWSPTLDTVMQTSNMKYGLGLSKINKDALVAFLKTFTDTTFTSDPNLSAP
jgi:cytochrome c peroxidase